MNLLEAYRSVHISAGNQVNRSQSDTETLTYFILLHMAFVCAVKKCSRTSNTTSIHMASLTLAVNTRVVQESP